MLLKSVITGLNCSCTCKINSIVYRYHICSKKYLCIDLFQASLIRAKFYQRISSTCQQIYLNLLIINCIVIVGMQHFISYPSQSIQVITICFTATFIYLTKANKSLFTDLKLQDTNSSLNKYFDMHNKLYKTTTVIMSKGSGFFTAGIWLLVVYKTLYKSQGL